MIDGGLSRFAGHTVLLLQGPMGPFFSRLANDLRQAGATVQKVNFNAGDALFYRRGAHAFRGTIDQWPAALELLIDRWQVDVVLLFGDCRPLHRVAREITLRRDLELGVFEEGYVRPDYITLERFGVNGHSRLPRLPGRYRRDDRLAPDSPERVGNAYWHGALWSVLYAAAATLGRRAYPHYEHHRALDAAEALRWLRGAWRKACLALRERGLQERLTVADSGRYFLVPLQVRGDAQIRNHSPYPDVAAFIEAVMVSFAGHAPPESLLVIKHHPMDRAHGDYSRLIRRLAKQLGLGDRCLYLHDQHLPALLSHARGVVVINSTAGLQALHHGRSTKVCGKAIFDVEGLTYRGDMHSFWADAPSFKPDQELLRQFHEFLVASTQINGNFYRRLRDSPLASGVFWTPAGATPAANAASCVAAQQPSDGQMMLQT